MLFQANCPREEGPADPGSTTLNSTPYEASRTNVELQRLCVPTGMALAPEDGYCVMCSTLPGVDRNDPTRYEMQLLVDASNIDPPPSA